MEPASPARLYATLVGALLVVLGILGFFYSASFGSPGAIEAALGVLRVNAWLNLLHIATGAIVLLLAGVAARRCALVLGALYTALGIWGFSIAGGAAILGFLPASGGDDTLHLVLGVLGLLAAAASPRAGPLRRSSRPGEEALEARPKPAGERL